MKTLLHRLERLEATAEAKQPKPWRRVIRSIIQPDGNGGALPFDPTEAYAPRTSQPRIVRDAGESVEAFEARALAHFANAHMVILGKGANARSTAAA